MYGYEFQYNKISCLGNERINERARERERERAASHAHCACPRNLEQVAAAGYLWAIAGNGDNSIYSTLSAHTSNSPPPVYRTVQRPLRCMCTRMCVCVCVSVSECSMRVFSLCWGRLMLFVLGHLWLLFVVIVFLSVIICNTLNTLVVVINKYFVFTLI